MVVAPPLFYAYGYMGDANTYINTPSVWSFNAGTCGGNRPTNPVGFCYSVVYNPPTGSSWAGVYWQSPQNNWGKLQGLPVAEGATKVTFWAKSQTAGLILSIGAGGINSAKAVDAGDVYWDTFYANNKYVTLTTSWAQYSLTASDGFPSVATGYGPVLGGFVFYAGPGTTANMTFWLDSIEWTQ
jgi:hypothetical protein